MSNHFTEAEAAAKLQELGFKVVPMSSLTWRCCSPILNAYELAVRRQHLWNCTGMLNQLFLKWPDGQFAEYTGKAFLVDEVIHSMAHSAHYGELQQPVEAKHPCVCYNPFGEPHRESPCINNAEVTLWHPDSDFDVLQVCNPCVDHQDDEYKRVATTKEGA